ncbi:hypothetical protein BX616_003361 [Lobosporangium transversale]|uniref:Uncharacterized protein n=1 Tax=Lobosporangium transversale TaxID=64571 RepID=A0A1Y2G7R8_9FUNG|nr:hypothetical protein BCR41DRAFT_363496 [Lobosporangium transversale]KAF9899017.1 hypothetical protein BX616_003361 [Lobosporangium transversale]ORZ01855.1 hypothetical protein BCR41DRAFT_363496 [Lobosporangium transversale]|eukprot:XP_021876152.1 hypothetical protein BCR41DRAFT_363496 [Lobosporangium transversale]
MSLLRHTVRRSFNVAIANKNTPAVTRIPLVARTFSSNTPQYNDQNLIKHAPGWEEGNASASEASVKADREPHPEDVRHLQNESVKHLKDKHGDSASMVDDLKIKAQDAGENMSNQAKQYANKAMNRGETLAQQGKEYAQKAMNVGENMSESLTGQSKEYAQKIKNAAEDMTGDLSGKGQEYANKAKGAGAEAAKQGQQYAEKAKQAGEEVSKQGQQYGEKAKQQAQQASETMMGGVKAGAEKMTQFVKESVDSAKKAVGMDK